MLFFIRNLNTNVLRNFKQLSLVNTKRLDNNYLIAFVANHLIYYPTPISLTYAWSFGFLAGMCLITPLISGIFLAMHYTPNIDLAFNSVEYIMRDVLFYPYFVSKDMIAFFCFLLFFGIFIFFFPNVLNHQDTFISVDPMKTPAHIFILPFYNTFDIRNTTYRPILKEFYCLLIALCTVLTWIGQCPAEDIFAFVGQICTVMNNQSNKDNIPLKGILIPFEYFIYSGILCLGGLITGLSYVYQKLKASKEAILMMESKYNRLEKLVTDLTAQNERLITLIEDLRTKNTEFSKIVHDLKIENDLLLQKVYDIKSATSLNTVMTTNTDPFVVKAIIITTGVAITLVTGYFITSYLASQFANSGLDLLNFGIDNQLKSLLSKIDSVKPADNVYTFIDSVNRKYVVTISNSSNPHQIQIDSQGVLVDLGSYISGLLENNINNQLSLINTVDVATKTISNCDLYSAVIQNTDTILTKTITNMPNIENTIAVTKMLSETPYFS